MGEASNAAATLEGLVRLPALQESVKDLFPSEGSLEWEIRQRRRDYIVGGALFEIGGRLLAQPSAFRRVAIEIGAKRLASRHGCELAKAPG